MPTLEARRSQNHVLPLKRRRSTPTTTTTMANAYSPPTAGLRICRSSHVLGSEVVLHYRPQSSTSAWLRARDPRRPRRWGRARYILSLSLSLRRFHHPSSTGPGIGNETVNPWGPAVTSVSSVKRPKFGAENVIVAG